MWSDLSTPWQVCLALSWESYCEGSIPIAAVIVDSDQRILAQGRNQAGGQESSAGREISGGPLAHAELNALLNLDYGTVNPSGLTLYTTVEPCPLCIGAICMAGIKQVHFAAWDSWAGSTNLLQSSPYLRSKQILAHGPEDERLETLVQMLQVACEIHHRHPRFLEFLEVWRSGNRRNTELGERLYRSGELGKMRESGYQVQEVVDRLAEMMDA